MLVFAESSVLISQVTSTLEIDIWKLMSLELLGILPDTSYVAKSRKRDIVDVLRRRDE